MSDNRFPHVFPAKEAHISTPSSNKSDLASFAILFIAVLMLAFGHHPISGDSMYPTYHDGQQVVTMRPIIGPIKMGDIVIAKSPNGYLIIKRVAATPGDTLVIQNDGSVTVNGEEYPYGKGSELVSDGFLGMTSQDDGSYSITLGKGQYYLLGDNRENSSDSRVYGPFKRSSIWEKVVLVYGK